jgi:glc operon protein GlcG
MQRNKARQRGYFTAMKHRTIGAMILALATLPSVRAASLAERKTLTLDGARRAISAAVAQAHRNHAGGVIAVVDDGGNLMALDRVDGTFAAGANISIGKARTAALFQKPTHVFEDIVNKGRTAMVALNDFTPLQGGVPIVIDGQIVGAVGVSGAANAQQDEELAMVAAAAVSSGSASVAYFDSTKVSAAFDKGAVLFNQGESYMVHASRREKPGMAEIHTKDADIVYVLDGTATLITGGSAIDAKVTEPDELRGTAISGGDTRTLKKGDVIIVPAGVPHWFKEVSNPFLYYVVKAR